MPNQAYLESVANAEGNLVLNVVLVTDSGKFPRQFTFPANISRSNLNSQIQAYLDRVTTAEATLKSLQPGLMDLTITPDGPPTDDMVKRLAFLSDVVKVRQLQRAVDLGLVAADDKSLTDLLASLKARYIESYTDML